MAGASTHQGARSGREFVEDFRGMDPAQQRVAIEVTALLLQSPRVEYSIDEDPLVGVVLPEVGSDRLIERLHATLGSYSVGSELVQDVDPTALIANTEELHSTPASRISLFEHTKTPANMRNFLSRTMPNSVNDYVFQMPASQSSLLAYGLLEMYTYYQTGDKRKAFRKEQSHLAGRHIGLNKEEQDASMIARAKAVSTAEIWRRINAVEQSLVKELDNDTRLALLDATEVGQDAVLTFLEQHREAHIAATNPEILPVPEGYKRHILRDASGHKHVILWKPDTCEIIVDNVIHAPETIANVHKDRVALLKCILKHKTQTFSSSDLHGYGVGKNGVQTEAGIRQAIRKAVESLEEITIGTTSGPIPILGYASARKYQLHHKLGGPKIKKRAAKKTRTRK